MITRTNASPKTARSRSLTAVLGWNRSSYYLMSAFALTILLLAYVWWPLAQEYLSYVDWHGEWWRAIDWLLIGIFLFMSLAIMAHANLRVDAKIIFVGLVGGLVIESWGTQTEIWSYYTDERPPLWIIPACPIAGLTIDRLMRFVDANLPQMGTGAGRPARFSIVAVDPFRLAYWLIFPAFFVLMVSFVSPTFDKSLTVLALLIVALFTVTPTNYRIAVVTFLSGAALGYFLERWGTTRECWTYYTQQTPPLFAVLAHGMAAVAFWRGVLLLEAIAAIGKRRLRSDRNAALEPMAIPGLPVKKER